MTPSTWTDHIIPHPAKESTLTFSPDQFTTVKTKENTMDNTKLASLAEGNPEYAQKFAIIARALAVTIDLEGLRPDTIVIPEFTTIAPFLTPQDLEATRELFQLFAPFFNPNYEV
jgi:hypothetical protein